MGRILPSLHFSLPPFRPPHRFCFCVFRHFFYSPLTARLHRSPANHVLKRPQTVVPAKICLRPRPSSFYFFGFFSLSRNIIQSHFPVISSLPPALTMLHPPHVVHLLFCRITLLIVICLVPFRATFLRCSISSLHLAFLLCVLSGLGQDWTCGKIF
ncbi:hypothetical protein C8R47DRAFT_1170150 [Mycena vitilis]|nr:hypothetical protein C8R47DRAFT_1170150 [Mycena vitilis]